MDEHDRDDSKSAGDATPAPAPHRPDATAGLASVAPDLERLARQLNVKSILVMRSEPESMVVAATGGEATEHYTVDAAGKKAGDDQNRKPLYCERVVNSNEALFVRDSRTDAVFAGNEDETEFGLYNYLGLPVHDVDGNVVGTVCALDNTARDYSAEEQQELAQLRSQVEAIVREDPDALG